MLKEKITNAIKKYFSEFALIFISVILAFVLTEWSSNQGEKLSQTKILTEISNGLTSDAEDLQANANNHRISLRAVSLIRNWAQQKDIPQDSITLYYYVLFRNYTPIINKTGYESLKSTSLKTISNDSLRFQIITLYDFHYKIIEKLEDANEEMQDFKNYFEPTNNILHPYMIFNDSGKLIGLQPFVALPDKQRKEILSYLWRMETNKKFKLARYEKVLKNLKQLNENIKIELSTND